MIYGHKGCFWCIMCKQSLHLPQKQTSKHIYSVQFGSQSCQILCHSMPGLPVHHQFLEFTQIHVHWVSDAIQPSHPLSSPFPPAFNLSQHQGLFKWVSSLHQVAKVLEFSASTSVLPMNTQDWSPLGWTGGIPLQSKGLSRVSPTYVLDISSFIWGCMLRLASGKKKHGLRGWVTITSRLEAAPPKQRKRKLSTFYGCSFISLLLSRCQSL